MSMDVVLRADVTVYLCAMITRLSSPLLPNGALFKWVLIVISNERYNLTSSQRALSNHLLTTKTFSSPVRF